jgi:hypothetical protein
MRLFVDDCIIYGKIMNDTYIDMLKKDLSSSVELAVKPLSKHHGA